MRKFSLLTLFLILIQGCVVHRVYDDRTPYFNQPQPYGQYYGPYEYRYDNRVRRVWCVDPNLRSYRLDGVLYICKNNTTRYWQPNRRYRYRTYRHDRHMHRHRHHDGCEHNRRRMRRR